MEVRSEIEEGEEGMKERWKEEEFRINEKTHLLVPFIILEGRVEREGR